MIRRYLKILKSSSFFLFGARGTGKTSLLRSEFKDQNCLWIDLLKSKEEKKYNLKPERLIEELDALQKKPDWVIIDEVQKAPALLDIVHSLIEEQGQKFALTGSSARKLKRGRANLLAGRAFVYKLFPFSSFELGNAFHLKESLEWGSLPKLQQFKTDEERQLFLDGYCHTYLKEEIMVEQLVRQLNPFRRFLEVAAQSNGEVVNFSRIATDVGADDKTVKNYFEILEDTLLGFFLPSYTKSIRKQILLSPKFYMFDTGVRRALVDSLHVPLLPGQSEYGNAFEHFLINEIQRLNHYCRDKYKLSYIRDKDGHEVDLVLERKGEVTRLIKIKSTDSVHSRHLSHLIKFGSLIKNSEMFCFCQESVARKENNVLILPWQEGLRRLDLVPD